ncbi:MAG: FKBP-type peptidyl-prolyl cis-trans isomerase [Chlorobi bacterium OLB7]|nr:MAG: FKBP-type peptidyl-prolyl cis-trans isomerase [Chlorobi bacterium OLB7]
MKKNWMALPALLLLLATAPATAQKGGTPAAKTAPPLQLKTIADSVNYALGISFLTNLRQQGVNAQPNFIIAGINDAANGKTALTTEQVQLLIAQLQQALAQQQQAKQQAQQQGGTAQQTQQGGGQSTVGQSAQPAAPKQQLTPEQIAANNKKQGEAFLAENGTRQGIITRPSGLQYGVITQGTGATPKGTDKVTVHYTGMLLDGTVFDSSVKRGQPFSTYLGNVIAGWQEGVQLMKVGSKYRFFIPPQLAYGANGAGGVIGPNATLVFDVELLGINQ